MRLVQTHISAVHKMYTSGKTRENKVFTALSSSSNTNMVGWFLFSRTSDQKTAWLLRKQNNLSWIKGANATLAPPFLFLFDCTMKRRQALGTCSYCTPEHVLSIWILYICFYAFMGSFTFS